MSSHDHYQRIWQTVLQIPVGKVASYGQIADLAGLPGRARLVGRVLGYAPPELRIPWYRVLRSNGSLAFTAGTDAANEQRQLLLEEGVIVKNNKVAKHYCWQPDLAELLFKLQF